MVSFLRLYCVLAAALLAGCATSNAPTSSIAGQTVSTDLPPASFKITDYKLQWNNVATLQTELRCATNAMTLQRVCTTSQAARSRADQDIALMNQLLQTHVVAQINSKLDKRGLKSGSTNVIELTPQSGYWSEAGWGSGILIQVLVTDGMSGKKWTHTVPADTGVQFFGALAAGQQTPEFAGSFANRLDSVLAQAGFYK